MENVIGYGIIRNLWQEEKAFILNSCGKLEFGIGMIQWGKWETYKLQWSKAYKLYPTELIGNRGVPISQYLNWRPVVTAVPKRLKQMATTEEFKIFKDDKIQKRNTFLDQLKSLKRRNIYKILMQSNKMIQTKAQV